MSGRRFAGRRSDDLRYPANHDLPLRIIGCLCAPCAAADADRPHGTRVHAAALHIEPAPIERREGHDFFGNRMTWIELDQPHDTLSVRVAARVAVKRDVAPEATPPWEEIREAAFASLD